MKTFLAFSVALLGLLLGLEAGSVKDIEHVVIFMQENRAFDHYYGTLDGVRGFNDRTAITIPTGKPVWYQPTWLGDYQLPFHMDTLTTSGVCANAPTMGYEIDLAMWNDGQFDAWDLARFPGMGMSYFKRQDLDYYYSLADNFLICDAYYQSSFTATNPNRLHLFTGTNGLSVGHKGVFTDNIPPEGFDWLTMGEILQNAGISWKIYQEVDNFNDNPFEWFWQYRHANHSDPLYQNGMTNVADLVSAFKADIEAGTLPQVSWIIAPAYQSEHANNKPPYGERLTSQLLQVLGDNPSVYAKTVFFLNYDEGGQFYDHHWTPTPPLSADDGISTVTTEGEVTPFGTPIGLGFRVPMTVISPWTRGKLVNSQVFDHTSVIQFLEVRFGIYCPNISPWRRAITGNLTSVFDFKSPNYSWPKLPDTSGYDAQAQHECETLPYPKAPTNQSMPHQEPGVRISRALPYEFHADGKRVGSDGFQITITNTGSAGAVFYVYNNVSRNSAPKKFTVEPGRKVSYDWSGSWWYDYKYALTVYGPNGFIRHFEGTMEEAGKELEEIQVRYSVATRELVLKLINHDGDNVVVFRVQSNEYVNEDFLVKVLPGQTVEQRLDVSVSHQWYDFSISTERGWSRRIMGRMEIGQDSISDYATGSPLNGYSPKKHPMVPPEYTGEEETVCDFDYIDYTQK